MEVLVRSGVHRPAELVALVRRRAAAVGAPIELLCAPRGWGIEPLLERLLRELSQPSPAAMAAAWARFISFCTCRVADWPVDKDILQRISKSTDAQFFEAKNKDGLALIYDEIDRLEKSEIELSVNAIFEELFPWPLAFGLVLLLLEKLLVY